MDMVVLWFYCDKITGVQEFFRRGYYAFTTKIVGNEEQAYQSGYYKVVT
jgi:hypothetical protein